MTDDRAAITDLIYRYAELIDSGDFEGLGELLSHAEFGGPRTPRARGADAITALFVATTRRFADGTPKTRHLVLNPIVEVDGDTATARSTFCVVQATDAVALQPIVVGRYYDTFARDGGDTFARDGGDTFARDTAGWHFTQRVAEVEMVGDVSDHLLIDPGANDLGAR